MDRRTLCAKVAIGVIAMTAGTNAWSEDSVVQTLDSVLVHSRTDVLEIPFDDPLRSADFFVTGISGTNFRACQRTALAGLYCLDGSIVVRTPKITNPLNTFGIINCGDPALNLDTSKGNPCTAMTVDLPSNVWLGTTMKGNSYGLVKAAPNPGGGACPGGTTALQGNTYCAKVVATRNSPLDDLTSVDGTEAATYLPGLGAGILGLENGHTAVYFPVSGAAPVVIASGKNAWGLSGNEKLTGLTAVQADDNGGNPVSHVLGISTNGRIISRRADGTGGATVLFNIPANRPPANGACPVSDPHFGIRASGESGLIYVSDRAFCQASALVANVDVSGKITGLAYATENVNDDLVLATGSHAPLAPTVAPGINIDLSECGGSCVIVANAQGVPLASLSSVQLASLESNLTLFQIKNIPDCRWDPATCEALLGIDPGELVMEGVIADPDGAGLAEAQLLNMTKLLPPEITELFAMSGGLPDMWLARQYRGQRLNDYTFEAFFGVTEDNVIFRETFEGEFDVQALAGFELGCEKGLPARSPLFTVDPGGPGERIGTLEWDIIATVSERFPTPATGTVLPFVATMTNADCGSSKSVGTRWSMKPYNLEVTPCTHNGNPNDVWDGDGSCPLVDPEADADDAVFAKLLLSLFDDFKLTLDQKACLNSDGNSGGAPLTASRCSALQTDWANAKDKLNKCWAATQQPKQSSGSQNCTSFVSQLDKLRTTLNGATVNGSDRANRVGELKARLKVITHVHDERFVPSIPAAGYDEPGQ